MTTNITAKHRAAFEALVSGDYTNFALFSCLSRANRPPPSWLWTETARTTRSARYSSLSLPAWS